MISKKKNFFSKLLNYNNYFSNFSDYVFYFQYGHQHFREYYKNCELETKSILPNILKKNSIIFDLGANVGYYSAIFSFYSPKGKIFAFEPSYKNFNFLRLNLKNHSNIYLSDNAVSNFTGEKQAIIHSKWNVETEERLFKFIKLDDFIVQNKIYHIDLIKIDIDGYELEALQGMNYILKKINPYILIEINHASHTRNISEQQIIDFLESYNYEIIKILDKENYFFKKKSI
jgi:FkbM family methyltransferase